MTLEVIGTGFGRTGTNSLRLALEQLGFAPCHHMFALREAPGELRFWQAAVRGEPVDWDAAFARYKGRSTGPQPGSGARPRRTFRPRR